MAEPILDLLQIKIEKAKRELPLETINAINAVDWRATILELRAKKGFTFEQLGDLELETELLLAGLTNPEDYPKELAKHMGISKAAADELVNEMNTLVFQKIREELIRNTERKKVYKNITPSLQPKKLETSPLSGGMGIASPDKGRLEGFETKKDTDIFNTAGIEIIDRSNLHSPLEEYPVPKTGGGGQIFPPRLPATPEVGNKIPVSAAAPAMTKVGAEVIEVHPLLNQKLSSSFQTPVVKTEHSLDNITKTNVPVSPSMKTKIPNVDPYREVPE